MVGSIVEIFIQASTWRIACIAYQFLSFRSCFLFSERSHISESDALNWIRALKHVNGLSSLRFWRTCNSQLLDFMLVVLSSLRTFVGKKIRFSGQFYTKLA